MAERRVGLPRATRKVETRVVVAPEDRQARAAAVLADEASGAVEADPRVRAARDLLGGARREVDRRKAADRHGPRLLAERRPEAAREADRVRERKRDLLSEAGIVREPTDHEIGEGVRHQPLQLVPRGTHRRRRHERSGDIEQVPRLVPREQTGELVVHAQPFREELERALRLRRAGPLVVVEVKPRRIVHAAHVQHEDSEGVQLARLRVAALDRRVVRHAERVGDGAGHDVVRMGQAAVRDDAAHLAEHLEFAVVDLRHFWRFSLNQASAPAWSEKAPSSCASKQASSHSPNCGEGL